MKYFLFVSFLITIYSCANKKSTEKEEPSVLKEYLSAVSDSFNARDLMYEPSLQFDILLDTINIPASKKHIGIRIIYPKISEKDCPIVCKLIDKLIRNRKKEFYEQIADENVEYDSSWKMNRGWGMWVEPRSLYQTEKVISFGIETSNGFSGMSSGFNFDVINYDFEKKMQIRLKDYFILNSHADTAYLEQIIGRTMNRDFNLKERADFLGQINFSFDDLYVYFYCDKYDILGWGITSLKRKYILDHINPEYR